MPKPTYAGSISGAGAQVVPALFTGAAPPRGQVRLTQTAGSAGEAKVKKPETIQRASESVSSKIDR